MIRLWFLFLIIHLAACNRGARIQIGAEDSAHPLKNADSTTLFSRFAAPKGFQRVNLNKNSFGYYLRNFPLKPDTAKVHLYNGELKRPQNVSAAVLDIDVGNKNLQQCADAIIRLRAEYLWKSGRFSEIKFHFTNGFLADYSSWASGMRIRVNGNQCSWYRGAAEDKSHTNFRRYLDMVFTYAGTISLRSELKEKKLSDISAGDVFVQAGSPGHAIVVMDVALDSVSGKKIVLLAQGYSPAQEMHVLKNFSNSEYLVWYDITGKSEIITPEWNFQDTDLRSF